MSPCCCCVCGLTAVFLQVLSLAIAVFRYNPNSTSLNVWNISEHQHRLSGGEKRILMSLCTKACAMTCCSLRVVLPPDSASLKIKEFSAEGMKEERGSYLLPTNLPNYMNSYPKSVVVLQQLEVLMPFAVDIMEISHVTAQRESKVGKGKFKGNVSAFNGWQEFSFLKTGV